MSPFEIYAITASGIVVIAICYHLLKICNPLSQNTVTLAVRHLNQKD